MKISWPERQPVQRFCCITMVKDEELFLEQWANHYIRELPDCGIMIVDHGSKVPVVETIARLGLSGRVSVIAMPGFPFDDQTKSAILSSLAGAALCGYETVITSDVDEILIPMPSTAATPLADLLDGETATFVAPTGVEFIHNADLEEDFDFSRPLLEQRRFVRFHSAYSKPAIWRSNSATFGSGQHHLSEPYEFTSKIALAHLKYVDVKASRNRQAQRNDFEYSDRQLARGRISSWETADPATWSRTLFANATRVTDQANSAEVFSKFYSEMNNRQNKDGVVLTAHTSHHLRSRTEIVVFSGF